MIGGNGRGSFFVDFAALLLDGHGIGGSSTHGIGESELVELPIKG